ncbi:hypothetical protein QN277_024908 [Acacia crassicarpa]|uniref:Uncharacterized protein n=1 Tax=Acacia crassicarpa TaxID=499986 RepID=A0AAE1MHU4_9FABA|nr:hypothetical protein QN277_024908 [Acacia crassicarpa]
MSKCEDRMSEFDAASVELLVASEVGGDASVESDEPNVIEVGNKAVDDEDMPITNLCHNATQPPSKWKRYLTGMSSMCISKFPAKWSEYSII